MSGSCTSKQSTHASQDAVANTTQCMPPVPDMDPVWGNKVNMETLKATVMQPFDADLASADIRRFSQLHSWYKHLPKKPKDANPDLHYGHPFYPVLRVGQQQRNSFEPPKDTTGFHWTFFCSNEILHCAKHNTLGSMRIDCALKYPVYLHHRFGNWPGLTDDGSLALLDACRKIWESMQFRAEWAAASSQAD
jgi:hypothetical protein